MWNRVVKNIVHLKKELQNLTKWIIWIFSLYICRNSKVIVKISIFFFRKGNLVLYTYNILYAKYNLKFLFWNRHLAISAIALLLRNIYLGSQDSHFYTHIYIYKLIYKTTYKQINYCTTYLYFITLWGNVYKQKHEHVNTLLK